MHGLVRESLSASNSTSLSVRPDGWYLTCDLLYSIHKCFSATILVQFSLQRLYSLRYIPAVLPGLCSVLTMKASTHRSVTLACQFLNTDAGPSTAPMRKARVEKAPL